MDETLSLAVLYVRDKIHTHISRIRPRDQYISGWISLSAADDDVALP